MSKKVKELSVDADAIISSFSLEEKRLKAEVIRLGEATRKLEKEREVLSDDIRKLRRELEEARTELKREKSHVDVLMKGFNQSLSYPFYSNNLR